jgi:hypothetical protein
MWVLLSFFLGCVFALSAIFLFLEKKYGRKKLIFILIGLVLIGFYYLYLEYREQKRMPDSTPSTLDIWQGGCFVEGTLVWTPEGALAIESMKEENIVYAYDITQTTIVEATVENVIRKTRTELLTIDGDLQVTLEHPMAVINSDGNIVWKEAGKLSVGECLVSQTGSCVNIRSITHRNLSSPVSVINLSVSLPNNFFVIMGDKPILVHNKIPVAM